MDGADRLVVVHPYRSEQAHGAEGPVREPVRGSDERDVRELGKLELRADTHERAAWIERPAEQREQRRPLLEDLEEPSVGLVLLVADLLEEPGRASDVQTLLVLRGAAERRPQSGEKLALLWVELRIGKPVPHEAGADR